MPSPARLASERVRSSECGRIYECISNILPPEQLPDEHGGAEALDDGALHRVLKQRGQGILALPAGERRKAPRL